MLKTELESCRISKLSTDIAFFSSPTGEVPHPSSSLGGIVDSKSGQGLVINEISLC